MQDLSEPGANYKEAIKVLKEQNIDERPCLDSCSAAKLVETLIQEAQIDGGSSDFFSILNIIFDYAFERNRKNEAGDCVQNELSYLIEAGLVRALAHIYKTLSRKMIVEGHSVDRSLAAICKTCLSVFEEIPSACGEFSAHCLSEMYSQWLLPGLKHPHPTTISSILELIDLLMKDKEIHQTFWVESKEKTFNLLKMSLDQLSRSPLVSKQLLDVVKSVGSDRILQSSVKRLFDDVDEKKIRSNLIAAMTSYLSGDEGAFHELESNSALVGLSSNYFSSKSQDFPSPIAHPIQSIRFGDEQCYSKNCFASPEGISALIRVEDSGQEIEPEIFYLDYKDIDNYEVDRKFVRLLLKSPVHPCVEKFFTENQESRDITFLFGSTSKAKIFSGIIEKFRGRNLQETVTEKRKIDTVMQDLPLSSCNDKDYSIEDIDSLNVKQLKEKLRSMGLDSRGSKEVLYRRLKFKTDSGSHAPKPEQGKEQASSEKSIKDHTQQNELNIQHTDASKNDSVLAWLSSSSNSSCSKSKSVNRKDLSNKSLNEERNMKRTKRGLSFFRSENEQDAVLSNDCGDAEHSCISGNYEGLESHQAQLLDKKKESKTSTIQDSPETNLSDCFEDERFFSAPAPLCGVACSEPELDAEGSEKNMSFGDTCLDLSKATTLEHESLNDSFFKIENDEELELGLTSQHMEDDQSAGFNFNFNESPIKALEHLCKKFENDKHTELLAAAENENSEIRVKALSLSSSLNKKSTEVKKRLDDLKRIYQEKCMHIKKRAKLHLQKYFLSVDPVKNELKCSAGMRMKTLKYQAERHVQKKLKSFSSRAQAFQEWQATEQTNLKDKIVSESKSSNMDMKELQKLLATLFQSE